MFGCCATKHNKSSMLVTIRDKKTWVTNRPSITMAPTTSTYARTTSKRRNHQRSFIVQRDQVYSKGVLEGMDTPTYVEIPSRLSLPEPTHRLQQLATSSCARQSAPRNVPCAPARYAPRSRISSTPAHCSTNNEPIRTCSQASRCIIFLYYISITL